MFIPITTEDHGEGDSFGVEDVPPLSASTGLSEHSHPVCALFSWFFLTTVFVVRPGGVPIVEGKRGWVMFVVCPPAESNILFSTATQCRLF